nr:MAG TPA: hypothetical protein [Caudoviricetes sp.]
MVSEPTHTGGLKCTFLEFHFLCLKLCCKGTKHIK